MVWIVAVPGLGLSAGVPARVLRHLAHPATVVELPAFGLPAPRGAVLDPDRLAGLLLDQLDAFTHGPAVLVGHSASCPVVAAVAALAPHRAVGLVLLGPITDPRARRWPALIGRAVRTATHEPASQIPRLLHDISRTGPGSMIRGLTAARRYRLDHTLTAVSCPVLIVRGRQDRVAPADWTATLAAAAPQGRACTLPTGAHMLPITHPATVAAVIDEFVATIQHG